MPLTITHPFVSGKTDGADTTLVQPSNWNAGHTITGFGTGVEAFLTTPSSANLAAAVTDETGSGALVFATSPTLVTPALGTPASGTLDNCTTNTEAAGTNDTQLANTAHVFAERTNTATLTNKTLTTPVLTNPSFSGTTSDMGTVTTIDINGGTIDGAVIGGSSAAAGTFTTLTSTGNTTLGDASTDTLNIGNGGIVKDANGRTGIGLTPTARNNTTLQIVDGIGFPATQVASSDANTLDDYEEGTFTPTIVGTSTAGVGTYSTQAGTYTKIGNRVIFDISLEWSAHTGTGNIRIGALPFTSAASNYVTIAANNLTFAGQLTAFIGNGVPTADVYSFATGGALTAVAIDTAAGIRVAGEYRV